MKVENHGEKRRNEERSSLHLVRIRLEGVARVSATEYVTISGGTSLDETTLFRYMSERGIPINWKVNEMRSCSIVDCEVVN